MKKILLTGGNGFIGKNIRESYLSDKYAIIAPLSRELDVADTDSVDKFFKANRVDYVIHAAVKPSHRNAKDFTNLSYTNTRMFFNLERHCAEYEKMLVLGSGAIYDMEHYRSKMAEESYRQYIPKDEHGYTKYVCEKVIENSRNIYDLRIFGIFGKYEDYAIRFISNAICKSLFDLPITILQDRAFDYLFVDDLPKIVDDFIIKTPKHHAYNITPDYSIKLSELAEIVKKITENRHDIQIKNPGMGLEYSGLNQRLKDEFSVEFTPIKKAVETLYDWYRTQKSQLNVEFLLTDK